MGATLIVNLLLGTFECLGLVCLQDPILLAKICPLEVIAEKVDDHQSDKGSVMAFLFGIVYLQEFFLRWCSGKMLKCRAFRDSEDVKWLNDVSPGIKTTTK